MLKLGDAVARWQPTAGPAADPVVLLEAAWEEIVGADVARNSRPARIAGGTLTVTTRSGAWSNQLSFLSEHVLAAVSARLPAAAVTRLQFRVGRLPRERAPLQQVRRQARSPVGLRTRPEAASAAQALDRFRRDVEELARERRAKGWMPCAGCGALISPGAATRCQACTAVRDERIAQATSRLLFEAPWLGFGGTAALVEGLQKEEYDRIRALLLSHWWEILTRARTAGRLSPDGRERLVASSYVLLHTKIPPEEIAPATVRSVLGDELNELLYGDASCEGGAGKNQKRRT